MNIKSIILAAALLTGTSAFSQDTTGSTRPQVIIPLGKKPAKTDRTTYMMDTTSMKASGAQKPLPTGWRRNNPKQKPKKAKAVKPASPMSAKQQ